MNYRLKNFLIDFARHSAWILTLIFLGLLITFVMMWNWIAGFILLGLVIAAAFAVIDNFV